MRARRHGLLSNEHFSVDGTLIESSVAVKSMRRRDGKDEPPGPGRNRSVDFHAEKGTNETHVSPIDPKAKLFRKSCTVAAKLSYMAQVLMDHRHGLSVGVEVTSASGDAEREAPLKVLYRLPQRVGQRTVAGEKAYDTADFVHGCRWRRHMTRSSPNRLDHSLTQMAPRGRFTTDAPLRPHEIETP